MIKKAGFLVLTISLLLAWFSPGLIKAQGELTVLDSSAQVDFPARLSFTLSAESDASITDIRLHYRVDRLDFVEVTSEVYLEFVPANTVSVNWSLEMIRIGGLPPGSSLEYWWTVADAGGNEIVTAPVSVRLNDNRYSWQSLTEGNITLYWYRGDRSFAQELMAVAQQALVRLNEYTGAELEEPVKLYIYASAQDLQGSMIYPQEWTGGVAFTRYGIMAIGISPENLDWGIRAIAHELTHLVIHQITLNPYSDLPTWLDEGLAMNTEGPLEPVFNSILEAAIGAGTLISVQSLSSPFSAFPQAASLSYAQSYSLVEFLITNYGQERMFELLETFREGSSYDGALERVYGFDTVGLDALWQDWISRAYGSVTEMGRQPVLASAGY